MKSKVIIMFMTLAILGGCSTTEVADYHDEKPVLDVRSYFNGTIDAWGMFQDRSGKVVKRFKVVVDASWKGDVGTLDEHFNYSDGTTQRRVWTITRSADGKYLGRADDVVGDALGEASGNALRWRYVLALPVDGKVYNVSMNDWMYQMDERTLLNRTTMTKFGFRVGEITLSFTKRQ